MTATATRLPPGPRLPRILQTAGFIVGGARFLEACRRPAVVADVASDIDLPLAVVRVLLGDLYQEGLITVLRPASEAPISDLSVMRNVLDGLKAL